MYSFLRCHGAALGHREICFPHSLRQLQPNPLQPQLEAKEEVEAKEEYSKTKYIYCLNTCNGTQWLLHHSIIVFRSRSKDKTKEIVVENQAIITISSHLSSNYTIISSKILLLTFLRRISKFDIFQEDSHIEEPIEKFELRQILQIRLSNIF